MKTAHALCLALLTMTPALAGAYADPIRLPMHAVDAMPRPGLSNPQRLTLTAQPPDSLQKAPEGLVSPLYGVLKLGPRESPTSFVIVVDEPDPLHDRLFVDANGNGDLTDDAPVTWKRWNVQEAQPAGGGKDVPYTGSATFQVRYGAEIVPIRLNLRLTDNTDPARATFKDSLIYAGAYAREGDLPLGGKTYHVMLVDTLATGDFRGRSGEGPSGVVLLIDVNGNGTFDARGETYDIARPFNIRGTTYEIREMSASGGRFTLAPSARTVAEIPPPPNLNPGQTVPPFEVKTLEGRTVRFPSAYKGRLVLLYFWASWCPDCAQQRPYVVAAYAKYHPQGLDILGVSLDHPGQAEHLATFTKQNRMPWAEIYDGKFWNAEIAQAYGISSIPSPYLVDGDTGEILAAGSNLFDNHLAATIEQKLAAKKPDIKGKE